MHQAEGFTERGMALSVSYNPTPATPLGFTARVAPSWGGEARSGADAMSGRETMAGLAHNGAVNGTRLDTEIGYGLPVGNRFVPRRRYRSWRRATSGCQTRDRTGAPSPSARGWTTSCTSSACFRRARTTTTWMPSRNSSRAASSRSRAGWSGSRRLLDAGTLRDDARLLRPAVDGTYEDGEPEWAPKRLRVRSTAATVRPASRTGRTAARDGRRHGLGRSRLQGGPPARRRRRHDLSHTAGAGSTPSASGPGRDRGPLRHTEAAAGVAGGSATVASIRQA